MVAPFFMAQTECDIRFYPLPYPFDFAQGRLFGAWNGVFGYVEKIPDSHFFLIFADSART